MGRSTFISVDSSGCYLIALVGPQEKLLWWPTWCVDSEGTRGPVSFGNWMRFAPSDYEPAEGALPEHVQRIAEWVASLRRVEPFGVRNGLGWMSRLGVRQGPPSAGAGIGPTERRVMRHQLTDARYEIKRGSPALVLEVDGREASFFCHLLNPIDEPTGWVYLGPGFNDICPPIVIPNPYGDGPDVELEGGWTDDPRVVALFTQFAEDDRSPHFQPGPVPIPDY